MLPNNQMVKGKIRENQMIPWGKQKQKYNFPKSIGCSRSSSKRECYSNSGLPQEQEKFQINNLFT